jgi:hypothetical protein
MPSAKVGPDQEHALEALWRKWVFPPPGIDRLSHYILSALPNLFGRNTSRGLISTPPAAPDIARRWS